MPSFLINQPVRPSIQRLTARAANTTGEVGLGEVALAAVIGLACKPDLDMGHEIAECREAEMHP